MAYIMYVGFIRDELNACGDPYMRHVHVQDNGTSCS
jgi:hypothetical protein